MRAMLDLIEKHRRWFVEHKRHHDAITPGESI